MSDNPWMITVPAEWKAACLEAARERCEYLEGELEKAVALGDIERASVLLCDLFGDWASCYVHHPAHPLYRARQAEIERRCAAIDPERYKAWQARMAAIIGEEMKP